MKALYILVSIIWLSATTISAEQVESVAGTLKDRIDDTSLTTLAVSGTINAADIDFINHSLVSLTTLDLSDAVIEPYSGQALANGRNSAPANTLPEFCLFGSKIADLKLPQSLKVLEEGCLAASSITSLDIPEGVTTLGAAICNGCVSLVTVTIPSTVSEIQTLSFKGCSSLSSITLPHNLRSIGNDAFNDCRLLAEIDFPPSLGAIGDRAFTSTALVNVDLAKCASLKAIGNWAFGHCVELVTATLPNSLSNIGDGVFFDCTSLETVSMPSSITALAPYMLKGAALADMEQVLTGAINTIGDYALYGNDRVTVARLPRGVTTLGDGAMAGMGSLTMLDATALDALPSLGDNVFTGTAGDDVTLLASHDMAPIFKATPQWQEFNVVPEPPAGHDTPIIDRPADSIKMKYDNNILYIKTSHRINTVTLTDMNGRTISCTSCGGENEASITITSGRGFVIVTLQYDDAATASVKTLL